jgi:hypothetical protein
MKKWLQSVLVSCLLLVAGPAFATILSGNVSGGSAFTAGGTFIKLVPPFSNPLGPPNSVGSDTFQSPNLYGFDESERGFLSAAIEHYGKHSRSGMRND